MDKRPLISICIPTNGVVEWLFPALESIYEQKIDNDLYEVVITDNGNDQRFKGMIRDYILKHDNIVYAETDALPFVNEIEAYKRSSGKMIKYSNHRNIFRPGSIQYLIDFAIKNQEEKPIVYFSDGVLDLGQRSKVCSSFDDFVKNLSYWSSWSTGMTIWKEDLDEFIRTSSEYNELFPHTDILFRVRDRNTYIIDNTELFDEIPTGTISKGNYDLFNAFGVEYPGIIKALLTDRSISEETYEKVLDKNLGFITQMYWDYCIRKRPCSYDLSGIKGIYGKYYTRNDFYKKLLHLIAEKIRGKL